MDLNKIENWHLQIQILLEQIFYVLFRNIH